MTWGLIFGVLALMIGCAALSFAYTWKQLKKEKR
jgi:hypothetical protein